MMEAIFGPFLGHFSWISEENIKEMGGGGLGGGNSGITMGSGRGPAGGWSGYRREGSTTHEMRNSERIACFCKFRDIR